MKDILNLDRYPIDRPDTGEARALVARCQADLLSNGMFNLEGLVRADVVAQCAAEVMPLIERESFTHKRSHNVYFLRDVAGLSPDHAALRKVETINHTLCADQIVGTIASRIYRWPPLAAFLAAVMEKSALYLMDDPLASVNVIAYRAGEALNWHFDRSHFTTTLLIQAPETGGEFQYRSDLRSDADPNYEGVARLLRGEDHAVRTLPLTPGTLNVFKGKNTLHRVTPPVGDRPRIVAIFSYYDRPGVVFSAEERLGFYGRAN
jgi:hypothetical protein